MLLNITLDNTCIIDLEKNSEYASNIKNLISIHKEQKINLRVVAVSASELRKDHKYYSNFNEFRKKITYLGLGNVTILPTLMRVGLSYVDYCLVSGRWLNELEKEIQTLLFPNVEMEYDDFCLKHNYKERSKEAWRKWANKKCDVLTLWSHIWYNGNIFVTRDDHFLKVMKSQLIRLGVGKILKPIKAVEMLDC